ncbi:hypothetical protein S7711_06049 [Stachybotrys chartarum IBT 7711]|uniref:SP-RING-type domain-containing protein n=1 Tax=Stachybotrys chartarum (strain CBS 109288 / IBT 7711) TaxID=1280523 RepID=A0A084B209_STACB|nr:hypothetical protein S7711_06049 [Stachybotrys chartarum IBT 7711]KFA54786.1 hypothetical protein S40293_00775 [Stachybotrys chartarum IBT 40293]KFA76327.1 hypothetical protein S40288_02938 [Stachybotrys chartarum IBT 40288]
MSRRLVTRGGLSAANTQSSASSRTAVLPDYEPPSCLLDSTARRALGELSNNRGTTAYEIQLKQSSRYIGISISDLHERLRIQRDRLAKLRAIREGKGGIKSSDEENLEAHVARLEKEVESLTKDHEISMRDLLDKGAELEDEADILGVLYTRTTAQGAASGNDSTVQDAEDHTGPLPNDARPHDVPSTLDAYSEIRSGKIAEYERLSMHERYALNNDYVAFKKLWHDAAVGEDGPPLPDASKWFDRNGLPVMSGSTGMHGVQGDGDDSDDDIAVSREVVSVKCPLTLRTMQNPYSNRKCKHTFEKSALLDYLPMQGEVQCAQTGCNQKFSRANFDRDFFLDQAMLRRIERARAAEESDMDMDEDEDEELEGDSELAVRGYKRRHSSRPPKTERG